MQKEFSLVVWTFDQFNTKKESRVFDLKMHVLQQEPPNLRLLRLWLLEDYD